MYHKTLALIEIAAQNKAELCASRLWAFLIHAAMAGVYLGFGVVLVFVLSTPFFKVQSPAVGLIMSSTFALALSLVMIAGADLFLFYVN